MPKFAFATSLFVLLLPLLPTSFSSPVPEPENIESVSLGNAAELVLRPGEATAMQVYWSTQPLLTFYPEKAPNGWLLTVRTDAPTEEIVKNKFTQTPCTVDGEMVDPDKGTGCYCLWDSLQPAEFSCDAFVPIRSQDPAANDPDPAKRPPETPMILKLKWTRSRTDISVEHSRHGDICFPTHIPDMCLDFQLHSF
ncbi:MAG: hypothetical protein M1833_002930 [Piccolia ochrophora]|nr:MAG: hypothetical protein M1833_002930 [Piccolia ochrophora]